MRAQILCAGWICILLMQSPVDAQPTVDDADAQQKAAEDRYRQQQALVKSLAEKHGYKLGEGEQLKFIYDPQTDEREKLRALVSNMTFVSEGESPLSGAPPKYEPSMLLFRQLENDTLIWQSMNLGISTLADVLANVLNLRRQQFDCPPNMLLTYMPGDWVLSWDTNQPHELSDTEIAAFEKILNEKFNLGVRVKWKNEKRSAIVLRGEYKANPRSEEGRSESSSYEGSFGILARRSHIVGSAGSYEDFKHAIGEVLMLPVVDEADVPPPNRDFVWMHSGEPVPNSERLTSSLEQRVLQSLHEQLGYDLKIEPREVRVLTIEPVAE